MNFGIDPGYKNIAIANHSKKIAYHIIQNDLMDFTNTRVIEKIFENVSSCTLYIERQFKAKNVYAEAFLLGYLKRLIPHAKIIRVQPKTKYKLCLSKLNCKYEKIRSIKTLKKMNLANINDWAFVICERETLMKQKSFTIENMKRIKIDDLFDSILLSLY
jgi:hypothetical protein